jgi:uncharacterized protein
MMKILIVGVSVRAMVESAIRSGYAAIALDAFGDRDLRAITESYSLHHDFHVRYSAQEILKVGRNLAFDAIAYTSDMENHPEVIEEFSHNHTILGNSPKVIASVRNWAALFAGLRRAGFSVPETIFPDDYSKPDKRRRWLIKPLLSGGGHGIVFLQDEKAPDEKFLLQEYLPGKPCSVSFVANGHECVVLGITEQLIGMRQLGSQDFRYCGNLLPCPEAIASGSGNRILDQARRLASFLTREYGLVGVNGMDVIYDGDRICLTEVNPRYSASMELIEQAYGLPIVQLHVRAIVEGALPEFEVEKLWTEKKFFGKAILFAERDAIAPDTDGWLSRALHDVPASGEKLPKGGPICTILADRPTDDETIAALIDQAAKLCKELKAC